MLVINSCTLKSRRFTANDTDLDLAETHHYIYIVQEIFWSERERERDFHKILFYYRVVIESLIYRFIQKESSLQREREREKRKNVKRDF